MAVNILPILGPILIAATIVLFVFVLPRALNERQKKIDKDVRELDQKQYFEHQQSLQKAYQEALEARITEPIKIVDANYFYKGTMMGYDEWAIVVEDNSSKEATIYFCTGRQLDGLKETENGPQGYVDVFDMLTMTDHHQAEYELGLNNFHPCDIEKQNESHLAGEGPMFQPPIPPLEYRLVADPEGFSYSNGSHWKTD
jgi:hypothetical protein